MAGCKFVIRSVNRTMQNRFIGVLFAGRADAEHSSEKPRQHANCNHIPKGMKRWYRHQDCSSPFHYDRGQFFCSKTRDDPMGSGTRNPTHSRQMLLLFYYELFTVTAFSGSPLTMRSQAIPGTRPQGPFSASTWMRKFAKIRGKQTLVLIDPRLANSNGAPQRFT